MYVHFPLFLFFTPAVVVVIYINRRVFRIPVRISLVFLLPHADWCQPKGRVAGATYFVNSPTGLIATAAQLPHAPYTSNPAGNGAVLQVGLGSQNMR